MYNLQADERYYPLAIAKVNSECSPEEKTRFDNEAKVGRLKMETARGKTSLAKTALEGVHKDQ